MAPTARKTTKKAPVKKAAPRRAGRPLRIGEVISHRDGVPVTIGMQITEAVHAGNYVETAAQAAGINKATLYDWMRRGARLNADLHEGRRTRFTADERTLMGFSDAVGGAIGQSEARDVTNLARLAQGGIPTVVETVKVDDSGKVLERSTRTTHTLPDAGVLEWRLERRFRERWGRQVEVTGAGGGPVTVDLGASARELLTAELDKMADRLPAASGPPPAVPPPAAPVGAEEA